MDGLDKLTGKILGDAKSEAEKLLSEANTQAQEIITKAKANAQKTGEEILSQADVDWPRFPVIRSFCLLLLLFL